MTRVLNERALAKVRTFLKEDAQQYSLDHFNNPSPYLLILDWAGDPDHGALPPQSAKAFAHWLNANWDDWCEEPIPVKDVLEGAVTDWCGGRVMPS